MKKIRRGKLRKPAVGIKRREKGIMAQGEKKDQERDSFRTIQKNPFSDLP